MTLQKLQELKESEQTKKDQKTQVEAKLSVLGEEVKKKYNVSSLSELTALEEKIKTERETKEKVYEEECEKFKEKWDV